MKKQQLLKWKFELELLTVGGKTMKGENTKGRITWALCLPEASSVVEGIYPQIVFDRRQFSHSCFFIV